MSPRTPVITHFAEAVHTAVGLQDLYGEFAAAALLDDDGTILEMRPFSGDDTCVVCAVEWAVNVADDWQCAERVVLLSSASGPLRECREDDVRLYQRLHDALDVHGIELVDWIQTDGDDIRSLTYTCDLAPTWDDQVPE